MKERKQVREGAVDRERRTVLAGITGAGVASLVGCGESAETPRSNDANGQQPNILVLVPDDPSAVFFGVYGGSPAATPNVDALAGEGVRFTRFFSTAPVCAPTRFGILTGLHAESCGPAHHMRAQGKIPAWLVGFPRFLQQAGYWTAVTAKEDYNAPLSEDAGYDSVTPMFNLIDRSPRGPFWSGRPENAPFFCFANYMRAHEFSGISPASGDVAPGDVTLPPYLPDSPQQRRQMAGYYNAITQADAQIGETLDRLRADGLYDETIIVLLADNGGILPRSKRFCYDSGHHVPLIMRFPPKWAHLAPAQPGATIDTPATTIDLAPTMLSLAGVPVPDYMQGRPLLGHETAWRRYAFGGRNRMDERYDFSRTVRSERFRYIRNYLPHLAYGQHIAFMWLLPAYRDFEDRWRKGELDELQSRFWREKPAEELYDLETDPDETENLAADPAYAEVLRELGEALDAHMLAVNDNGFIPEGAAVEGYDESRVTGAYPLALIMQLAARAARRDASNLALFLNHLAHDNAVVRYWAVMGLLMLGPDAMDARDGLLNTFAADDSTHVRIAAAEALLRQGEAPEALDFLAGTLRQAEHPALRLQAANALANIGDAARPVLPQLIAASLLDESTELKNAALHTVAVLTGTYSPRVPLMSPDTLVG